MDNSLQILAESLDEKIKVLQDVQEYNLKQEAAFQLSQPDMDSFDEALEEKEVLINRILKLDEGFEILFERVSRELEANKAQYADQIKILKEKVAKVTELSVEVQAQEARNKKLVEAYFAKQRAGIGQGRKGSRAALDYYKNMNQSGVMTSQYMDSKH